MKLEQERIELYDKVKLLENQKKQVNNRTKQLTNKEKECLRKKTIYKVSDKEKNNMIRDYIRQGLQEEQLKRNYNNKDRLSCIIKNQIG